MRCLKNNKSKAFKLDELVKYVITDTTEINGTTVGNWLDSFERNIKPYLQNLKRLYE